MKAGQLRGFVLLLCVLAVVSPFVAMISSTIWPAQITYLAPIFCTDEMPTAVVVSDTWTDSEGQSTNFTLYCYGPRGQIMDAGWWIPELTMAAVYAAIFLVIYGVIKAIGRLWMVDERTPEPSTYREL